MWQLSIQFRTFSPNAVILVVDSPFSTAFYGLYLLNGQLIMDVSSGGRGSNSRLASGRLYNDGQWYQVRKGLGVMLVAIGWLALYQETFIIALGVDFSLHRTPLMSSCLSS